MHSGPFSLVFVLKLGGLTGRGAGSFDQQIRTNCCRCCRRVEDVGLHSQVASHLGGRAHWIDASQTKVGFRRDRREEAAARVPPRAESPMEVSPPRQDSPMKEDDDVPRMELDSSRWINHFIRHAASFDLTSYQEAMSRPDAKQ